MMLINTSELPGSSITAGPVDPVTAAAFICIIALLLLFNGVIIGIILFNRSLLNDSFSVHILTLCFTDFVVGLLSIPIIAVYIYRKAMAYTFCAASIAGYAIGQCATLYHVFGICIYRVLVLRKNEQASAWKQQYLYYHIPCVWISSIVVVSFPFLYWGQADSLLIFCSGDTVLGHNYNKSFGFIMGWYIPALFLTNILYIYLKVLLYKRQQQIFPMSAINQARRRTHITIGIILILFNVFLLPFIIAFTAEFVFESVTLSRELRSVLMGWATLNSVFNPIVYAGRIKPLRDYVLAPFRGVIRSLRNTRLDPDVSVPKANA